MEISEIQNILHQHFVFCRQLPNNLYKNEKYDFVFLVSPIDKNAKKRLDSAVSMDYIVKGSNKDISLISTDNNIPSIILRDAGNSPVFNYYFLHAFLGSILGAALKSLDENLILREDGLYLQREYPLRDNHHQTIHTELVTNNFVEILNLFKLDPHRILTGFKNKNEYFSYLCESPYINSKILLRIKDSDCDYLKNFYVHMQKNAWNALEETDSLPSFNKQKSFFSNFKDFSINLFESKFKLKLKYFLNVTEKSDSKILMEKLKQEIPSINGEIFGRLMAQLKKTFESKGHYKDFLYTSTQDDVVKKLKTISHQMTAL